MAWQSGTKLVLLVNNSNADDTGNYTNSNAGTPVYDSGTKYEGTHSLKMTTATPGTNCVSIDTDICPVIQAMSEVTFLWYLYHPSGTRYTYYHGKGTAPAFGATGEIGGYVDNIGNVMDAGWNGAAAAHAITSVSDSWIQNHITWESTSGGTLKIYYNGSLIATRNPVSNSFGAENNSYYFGNTPFSQVSGMTYYVDRYIVAEGLHSSIEQVNSALNIMQIGRNLNIMEGI